MSDKPIEADLVQPSQALAVNPKGGLGKALEAHEITAPVRDAAQQRTDAIGGLLAGAYAKASTLKLSDSDCEKLTAEFPDEAVRKGAKGDETLLYIEHAYMRDRLNQVFGPGRWSLVQRRLWGEDFRTKQNELATRLYAECVLLVKGCYVGEAIGAMVYYPNNPKSDYSEASEGAQSEALRRICAKSLGIGIQVYKKDWCEGWKQRQRHLGTTGRRSPPQAAPAQPTQQPIPIKWPMERWLPKIIDSIQSKKTNTGREYKAVTFWSDKAVYSSFHAMQGVKSEDHIWTVIESKEKNGVTYFNIVDWQPDTGAALECHKEHLLKRLCEEGQPVIQEFVKMAQEQNWLLPNVETETELELRFVPRDAQAIEALIDVVKERLGA